MEIFEITGFQTGVSEAGVNFLQPSDSFQNIENGYIYRQVLQSRKGINEFAPRLTNESRVYGIFEHILPDGDVQLLVFDANFCNKYNTTTGNFDQVPFGGSLLLAGYTGFALTDPSDYISGASYPIAQFKSDNTANPAYTSPGGRFIFSGSGINPSGTSTVFFYDSTSNTVKDFTNLTDNPNYAAPTQGDLNRSKYVIWFNGRLNFISPQIASVEYKQGVLYSAIRTINGNGDKFNIVTSGLLPAETSEVITGVTILGQVISLNFSRSNWTLEKTQDAFNPYFIRKVPSVLGTNASFSAVSWDDKVKSIGKTGIISTDGRSSERIDNKIPNFTADQIDQINFEYTYGGFDRVNNQFLWSYELSESGFGTQNKVLVNNYEEKTWSVYDLRLTVFGQTDLGINLSWDQIDETAPPLGTHDSWSQWDTTEDIWNKIGLGEAVQKTLAGDNLGFVYDINTDFDDYVTNITNITNASEAVLTIDASAFQINDLFVVQSVVGMLDGMGEDGINNFDPALENVDFTPYRVLAASPTSITITADTSLLTAYTSGGTVSKVISFYAETIPFNPFRSIGRRCYVSHVEFLIDIDGIDNSRGYLKLDVFQDEEEAPYKQNILLIPSDTQQGNQWVSVSINNEANFHTFALKQESPAVQVRITSIRIHCEAGGLTSG